MRVLEKVIEARVSSFARDAGCMSLKIQMGFRGGQAGWPDRMFLYNGRALFVEFKSKGGQLTALQRLCIEQLQKHGFQVEVVDNVADGIEIIEEFVRCDTSLTPTSEKP